MAFCPSCSDIQQHPRHKAAGSCRNGSVQAIPKTLNKIITFPTQQYHNEKESEQ
jgi:hypothetical protein